MHVVAAGRRNNPPDGPVPPLCSFNPLHYMELPELFMEFISSMTGKSPSTTGAGSEGALTKGPFNAMPAVIDLNASLLAYALTGYDGWLSAAGYVGPHVKVDHDISLLIPETFSRMSPDERDAHNLIAEGALERLADFEHDGAVVAASRLGYRITDTFAAKYFGRIFLHPHMVLTPEMLRPELQDIGVFAQSVATIVTTHERVARAYFEDGTDLPGRPAAARAPGDHGPRGHLRGLDPRLAGVPLAVHPGVGAGLRLVRRPVGRQAGRGQRTSHCRARRDREVRVHPGQRGAVGPAGHAGPGRCRPGRGRSACPARSSAISWSARWATPPCDRRAVPGGRQAARPGIRPEWTTNCIPQSGNLLRIPWTWAC